MIPKVKEWKVTLADGRGAFRVLAPTKQLARLNLRAEGCWYPIQSIGVVRRPIGQDQVVHAWRDAPRGFKGFVWTSSCDPEGEGTSNALVFATRREAELYVADLAYRWTAVVRFEAREVTEAPTHTWINGEGVGPIGGERRMPPERVQL
jgi:hypothetical protein